MAQSSFPLMFQPLARYVDFNGRSRRSEYWLWALFMFLVNVALTILQYSVAFSMAATAQGTGHAAGAAGSVLIVALIRLVVFFGLLLPNMAVAVRRMHDINRTGWWIVFPYVICLIATIVVFSLNGADFMQQIKEMKVAGNSRDPSAAIGMFMSIMRLFTWIVLPTLAAKVVTFVFRVTEGTQGTNRYGPDPKGSAPTNVF